MKTTCLLSLILLTSTTLSCKNNEVIKDKFEAQQEANIIPLQEIQEKDYTTFLTDLQTELSNSSQLERKDRFFTFYNKDVPYYWKGTKWDFNGMTRIPKEGYIACGYFVTNTLSDFGLDIKRIYLAQQPSSTMITELCDPTTLKRFSDFSDLETYISNGSEDEVFIIGLDFHTGFILKEGDDSYFLHSNYINTEGVVKEKTTASLALKSSNSFMIGSLSKNDKLFE